MRTPPDIISQVPITYGEFIEVLTKMGFHKEFDGKNNRFINEKYKSLVVLPVRPNDEILEKVYVAQASFQLYMQGAIRQEENIIKKVQQNRLKKSKSLKAQKSN